MSRTIHDLDASVLRKIARSHLSARDEEALRLSFKTAARDIPARERVTSAFEKELENLDIRFDGVVYTFNSKGYSISIDGMQLSNKAYKIHRMEMNADFFDQYNGLEVICSDTDDVLILFRWNLSQYKKVQLYFAAKYILETWLPNKIQGTLSNAQHILNEIKKECKNVKEDPMYSLVPFGLKHSLEKDHTLEGDFTIKCTRGASMYGSFAPTIFELNTVNGRLGCSHGVAFPYPVKNHSVKVEYQAVLKKIKKLAKDGYVDPSLVTPEFDKYMQEYFKSDAYQASIHPDMEGGTIKKSKRIAKKTSKSGRKA